MEFTLPAGQIFVSFPAWLSMRAAEKTLLFYQTDVTRPARKDDLGTFYLSTDHKCLVTHRYLGDHALELIWDRVSMRGHRAPRSEWKRRPRPGTS